jgi:magnesium transporter
VVGPRLQQRIISPGFKPAIPDAHRSDGVHAMVSIYYYHSHTIQKLSIKEFTQVYGRSEGVLWIDLEDPSEAEEETLLVSLLDFHPLAIEDCQRGRGDAGHLPKVEDFGDYLFVIINPVEAVADSHPGGNIDITTVQLSVFMTKRLLVTHHYQPMTSITNVLHRCEKNPQSLGRGPDYLFHLVIDDIVDNYTPIMDQLDTVIDSMEEQVFRTPAPRMMENILELKKTIMTIRRIATYQKEMLHRLSRGEFRLITVGEMAYYRNVYDHLVRMADLAESYRDVINGLLDAYLSVTSNNLNQVMKVLTIISTIFLPLSFITGFFGMNFKVLPGAEWEYGVAVATLFMIIVGGGMITIFRKKNWM